MSTLIMMGVKQTTLGGGGGLFHGPNLFFCMFLCYNKGYVKCWGCVWISLSPVTRFIWTQDQMWPVCVCGLQIGAYLVDFAWMNVDFVQKSNFRFNSTNKRFLCVIDLHYRHICLVIYGKSLFLLWIFGVIKMCVLLKVSGEGRANVHKPEYYRAIRCV